MIVRVSNGDGFSIFADDDLCHRSVTRCYYENFLGHDEHLRA